MTSLRNERYIVFLLVAIIIIGIGYQFIDNIKTPKDDVVKETNTDYKDFQKISKINLNKATLSQLIRLPNIGPVKARSIISYREKLGGFKSLKQLTEISGIGVKTLEKLKDYLYIEDEESKMSAQKVFKIENKDLKSDEDFPINVNEADLDTLQKLPGIGEVKAKAIIDYRIQNGGFKKIEEIKEVKGIGEKTFERIKDMIEVY